MQSEIPTVFVVSDSAGDTGESVVRAAAVQFNPFVVNIRKFPFVECTDDMDRLLWEVRELGGVIVFTLVIPEMRDYLMEQAKKYHITAIDILGPIIYQLEKSSHTKALSQPGIIHQLNEDYFRKVEAVEFAVKYDDGRDPNGVLEANIVLVGVSRTSKTPLSMYLAHKKYKVANVPLVPEIKPPKELFTMDKKKIIGLKINSELLVKVRQERLKTLGLEPTAIYANMQRIQDELDYADHIMKEIGCPIIDVSNKAVEEAASLILNMIVNKI